MIAKQPSTKKILALHGVAQSGPVFLERRIAHIASTLAPHGYTIHALTGPCPIAGTAYTVARQSDYRDGDEERSWWETDDEALRHSRIEDAMALWGKTLKEEGPFVGVIGFSQGGCAGASIAAMLEPSRREHPLVKKYFPPSHPPLEFLVMFSGNPYRYPDATVEWLFYSPSGEPSDRANQLQTRTLAFYGEKEWRQAQSQRERQQWFISRLQNGDVRSHPWAHAVPRTQEYADIVTEWILRGRRKECSQCELSASYASNASIGGGYPGAPPARTGLDLCSVVVTYTHPGWNDTIKVTSLLPLRWNDRFIGLGGGGWAAGGSLIGGQYYALGHLDEYAVAWTDARHSENSQSADPKFLTSPGNINWPLFVDFGSQSLHDLAVIGKGLIEAYYQKPSQYSYWYGGSQGGRQGHMLAQRYPEDFNGLVAHFPAINWVQFVSTFRWPVFVMDLLKTYPSGCEVNAFTRAAIEACDELDGVKDGVVSHDWACDFKAADAVGKTVQCGNFSKTLTVETASVMEMIWGGPKSATGKFQWYGIGRFTNLTENAFLQSAVTQCDAQGDNCQPQPNPLPFTWDSYAQRRNPSFSGRNISYQDWDDNFHDGVVEWQSIMATNDADLSRFKRAGGKLINWHGTVDSAIPYNGSADYFHRLVENDPETTDYYRLFTAPGVTHTASTGFAPTVYDTLDVLREWVENGVAPETLSTQPLVRSGQTFERDLCLFPKVQYFIGGDATKASSFICV